MSFSFWAISSDLRFSFFSYSSLDLTEPIKTWYLVSFLDKSLIKSSRVSSLISNERFESEAIYSLSFSSSRLILPEMVYNSSLILDSSGDDLRRVLASKYFLSWDSSSLYSLFLDSIILSNSSSSFFLPWSSLILEFTVSKLLVNLSKSPTICLFWYIFVLIESSFNKLASFNDLSLFNLVIISLFSPIFLVLVLIVSSYIWMSSFFLSSLISDWQTGHLLSTSLMSDNGSSNDLISWFKLIDSLFNFFNSSSISSISFLILVLRVSTRLSKLFKSSLVLIGLISSSNSDKTVFASL